MANMQQVGPSLSISDIEALERRIGRSLPSDYASFLLASNGGAPSPNIVDIIGFGQSPTDVQVIFGINFPVESCSIEWQVDTLEERLPSDILPIACDSGANVFCVSLRSEDHGTVLYCDLQSVFGGLDAQAKFYRVAPDFRSFLGSLRTLS